MKSLIIIVRWTARVAALPLVLLVLAMLVAEGIPNVFKASPPVQLEFLGMAAMVGGLILGWFRPLGGGLLSLSGFVLFCIVELSVNGKLPGGAIPLFAIPAFLFLVSAGLAKAHQKSLKA